jgi:hypothetical protein
MRPEPAEPMKALFSKLFPRLALPALLAALGAPAPALAWGPPGHRLVAGLAEAQLHPAARAEALRLLASEGEAADGLAGIANWADDFRKNGGERGAQTGPWHYLDFRDGCDYLPARDCPRDGCVVAAIDQQLLRLSDRRNSDAERVEALKFLVHLVGDVHQPLHASPMPDQGGNDFQISLQGEGTNLHKVWDTLILQRAMAQSKLDEDGYLRLLQAQPPLPPDATRRSDRPAREWALQSCRLVQAKGFYPPAHKLGDDYLDAQRPLVDRQLRLAGARLADMLNFALDPPPVSGTR